jgi:hypothetical protein
MDPLAKKVALRYAQDQKKEPVAVAPPGWENTVKEMKDEGKVENPWALAWWMKNQGYESHK